MAFQIFFKPTSKKYCSIKRSPLATIFVPPTRNWNKSRPFVFIKKLEEKFSNVPIQRVDERFTSKMAFQTMIDSGLNKKQRRNKALIDEISATIILQSYLYNKK